MTTRTARLAADPDRRKAVEDGEPVRREVPSQKRWDVRWHDDRTPAQAIVDKLLKDDGLAHEVWKALQAHEMRVTRSKQKRRSVA